MRSGRYRHKVVLLRRSDDPQSSGQVAHSFVEFARVWAEVCPIAGREFFAAAQVQSEVTTKVAIRFRDDVDETCRVGQVIRPQDSPPLYQFFDIQSVITDEKTNRRGLMLMCVKREAEGWRG